jgi:xanthine dioxygenase
VTEGKEIPFEDLPPFDEDKIKTLPMVWHNPLVRLPPFSCPFPPPSERADELGVRLEQTGEKSLMIHGQVAMRVNVKDSPDAEVKVLSDLGEVRAFLQT